MAKNALIGYTGFVGSHLIQNDMDFYNTKNIQTLKCKSYDVIYCSALPAEKWKANKHPEIDYKNMKMLIDILNTVSCSRFILISTVDVYNAVLPQSESPDAYPNVYSSQPYGRHRREFEEWVTGKFPNVHIFRLPALFGHGLKKNALYDLLHKNQIDKLRGDWKFQWYNIEWLQKDIQKHIESGNKIVNLVTPPINLSTIQTMFFPDVQIQSKSEESVNYNITSNYGYSHSLEDVFVCLSRFIRNRRSRFLVSELAWKRDNDSVIEAFLRSRGITQYEIVPSKRNWDMTEYNNVYSAQSILYGIDIQIFQEQARFLDILELRMKLLSSVGTKVLIFGSPKQRIYSNEDAVTLFRKVGDLSQKYKILFCLENNASIYGGNWMTTVKDTARFVRTVNHPYIRMNLDVGSMLLENETEIPDIELIGHVQISFPNLAGWTGFDSNVLKNWDGKISLEMLNQGYPFESIDKFLQEFSPSQTPL